MLRPVDSEHSKYKWLINSSEIYPSGSAILGNNPFVFYSIHCIALFVISVSLVTSFIVIFQIHTKWRNHTSKLDFPVRFPLYLAVADILWGLSHLTDHAYLVHTKTYTKSYFLKQALSMNLWFFFGYQQMMHASIAIYTYLRVVHRKKLDFGKWEWKLHLMWFCVLLATVVLFFLTDSFGNTGYWMAHDATTLNGQIMGIVISLTSTFNATCTVFGYYRIKKTVVNIQNKLRISNDKQQDEGSNRHHSIASKCLTTYVCVASCLYCPLALLLWINVVFQIVWGMVEPVSCLLISIVANSSGWANAYGYLHNENLKKNRKGDVVSSGNNSTDLPADA